MGFLPRYSRPGEIRSDGSCPREEARTRSLSYSTFNLDAFSVLCRLAQVREVDLWHYQAPSGASVKKAVDYMLPFVVHAETWKKEQIAPADQESIVFPALAAVGFGSGEILATYKSLPRKWNSAWVILADCIAGIP